MLRHRYLKNRTVATAYGSVTLDEKGESKDLSVNHRKALGNHPDFEYVEEKKTTTKKSPAKKTTRKSTAKKDEDKE